MSTTATSLLPTDVSPLKYQIKLVPNLNDFTFRGEETIDIEVRQATPQIVLNAAELEVQKAEFVRAGRTIQADEIHLDADAETATLRFRRLLPTGTAQLSLRFRGQLNDKLRGLYRSQYTRPDGTKRTMATTQFEAADARRAFPCWDEPAYKARFELSVVIPSDLVAISNMPVAGEEPDRSGAKVVRFAETPAMSTYLVALMVGEFEAVEADSEGVLVRVWTTPGKKEQGRFALDVSCRALRFYQDYFGIPYPLPKLDLIAIPDFAAGAMENWGAITYRETALLVDPEHSSAATRQRVAIVVAHEIAHMWFGDLSSFEKVR
jgi:puromycin-sensitive aminopeptidase